MTEIEKYRERLMRAKKAYYDGEPILSDENFDLLEEEFRQIAPEDEYFKLVGAPIDNQGNKIKHLIPMRSMGKAKNKEEFDKWIKKIKLPNATDYCVEPKIDGLSATCKYKDGKLVYVATRGDGEIGQDITHIAQYVTDIKKDILFSSKEIEVRGELYLPTDTKFDTKGKPLRNNCVGLINRQSDREDLKYVRFVAYQIVGSNENEWTKLNILEEEGFNTVFRISLKYNEIMDFYKDYLNNWRATWEYETDGLTVVVNDTGLHEELNSRWEVSHHNHYNLAIKPPSKSARSTITGINWQMSRQGNLIPVAEFEPVTINGASISRATLNNYEFAEKLDIRLGDVVSVVLNNDVIPGIGENLSVKEDVLYVGESLIINRCPHCNSLLDHKGVHLHCPNKDCSEQILQKILYWVKESDTENVAEGTLRALFELGIIKSIADLYTVEEKDLKGIEGFQDKKIKTFVEGFRNNKELTAVELLAKLNIPLVRTKALNKLGIRTIEDFKLFHNEDSAIGRNVVEWKRDNGNLDLLDELLTVITLREEKVSGGESLGIICMTGKSTIPRKELEKLANDRGYEVSSSVTKGTSILLTDDVSGGSSKLVKARKLGVKIKTYEEFFDEV